MVTSSSAESKQLPTETSKSPQKTETQAAKDKTATTKTSNAESSARSGLPSQSSGKDLRSDYSARTVEALNQFSKYTRYTPTDQLDLRCEFDLPRFKDLTDNKPISVQEDHQNFLWF